MLEQLWSLTSGSLWVPSKYHWEKKAIRQELMSFVYGLSVCTDRTISHLLCFPSHFPKAAPKKKPAIGFIFVLDSYLPSITEMHSKQFYNQHSKFNIKIANLLTTQIVKLPTTATGSIR